MNDYLHFRQRRQTVLQVPCATVRRSANRLDASSYCGKSAATRQLISDRDLKTDRLGDLAVVSQPTVFGKRFMMAGSDGGIPLYSSGELMNYEPQTDSYIAQRNLESIRDLIANPGTLLFTRSGSVGRVVLTPPTLANKAIQDDVLKVIPETTQLAHYLYIYFSSPLGNSLLGDAAFGSVVQHIKVDHVRELPVFRISPNGEKRIARLVEGAISARASAHELLQAAKHACLEMNKLPALSETLSSWLDNDTRRVAFLTRMQTVAASQETGDELRLEAHFHNPVASMAIANLHKSPSQKRTVDKLTKSVFFCNRFSRTFVEEEHGIPYLVGKNIVQIRPQIERYLSITQTEELEDYKLRRGWILVTCSGTIGRTCFVWKNFEKWVATHDLIRVIGDENEVDPAYLYAFLSCPYGYEQIQRFRHGSVVDHVTPEQIARVIVALPSPARQREIGDLVRAAYESRAEALRLEDDAEELLMREISGQNADTLSRKHV